MWRHRGNSVVITHSMRARRREGSGPVSADPSEACSIAKRDGLHVEAHTIGRRSAAALWILSLPSIRACRSIMASTSVLYHWIEVRRREKHLGTRNRTGTCDKAIRLCRAALKHNRVIQSLPRDLRDPPPQKEAATGVLVSSRLGP
jgi:hypothetical protein